MSRIRYLKPDFFKDDKLAELSCQHRLLFAGLWCLADREGRLEDRPKFIKAEIFPYEEANIEKMLTDLNNKKFVTRYEMNNKSYILINNFLKHQKPHHTEKASEIPAHSKKIKRKRLTVNSPLFNGEVTVISPCDNGPLTPSKGSKREVKGKGEEEAPLQAPPPKFGLEDYIQELKQNPAYKHIGFELEVGKMWAWLRVNPNRRMTKRFVLNWLNRIEPPLETRPPPVNSPPPPPIMHEKPPSEEERQKALVAMRAAVKGLAGKLSIGGGG